ncbi:MAG: hypothetical protein CM1200mP18_14900 [Gammaproteobacteria bacterium]|nr:MAG: hypothetical protein CM1200mP18_14900 [Gammaproteobacteria bacterium]
MRSGKGPNGTLSPFEGTLVEFYRYLARSLMAQKAHPRRKSATVGSAEKIVMIETISAEELARDPGYPGMAPEHVAQTCTTRRLRNLLNQTSKDSGSWNTGGPTVVRPMG